jgi:hypothetical protein
MFNPPRYWVYFGIFCLALLGLATNVRAQGVGALNPPKPTPLEPGVTTASPTVTYDYGTPNSCTGCHFIDGYDFLADAVGVAWSSDSMAWQRTGHGWLDSRHAQAEYGENNNTFCTKCHSPLQASAISSFSSGNIQAVAIPDGSFASVNCEVCHLTHEAVGSVFDAENPTANTTVAIYLWKGLNNPASYQAVLPGQEDQLCLHCHEEHHSTNIAAFEAMYSAGVRCMDCHMAPYQMGGVRNSLAERHHDWKVAENLPYSCGVSGSLSGFGCHSEFGAASAQQFIPFLMQQHIEWWNLPPFTGVVTSPQVAASAHSLSTSGDYRNLWNQIQQVEAAR